jgi:hypothetical protein
LQDSQPYRQSLLIEDNEAHGFKNCSTEICPNPGSNPLKSTCKKDGAIHIIGYFCDVCKRQLQEIGKRSEQNNMYEKGVEYNIGF